MDEKHLFFARATDSKLTGEQARVLFRMLASEYDGVIGIRQTDIAAELGMPESNVSRSIKALMEAELISKTVSRGHDGETPIFRIATRPDSHSTTWSAKMFLTGSELVTVRKMHRERLLVDSDVDRWPQFVIDIDNASNKAYSKLVDIRRLSDRLSQMSVDARLALVDRSLYAAYKANKSK